MPIGIAEIHAASASRPFGAPLDRNAVLRKPRLPVRELHRRHREGDVQRTVPVVRWDRAARQANRLERRATTKQQEDALAPDIVGAKPRVTRHPREAQNLLVEIAGTAEIVDVKTRLDHPVELRRRQAHGLTTYSARPAPRPTCGSAPTAGPIPR